MVRSQVNMQVAKCLDSVQQQMQAVLGAKMAKIRKIFALAVIAVSYTHLTLPTSDLV